EVEAVIMRAMNLDPAGRFQSVRQLATALLPFASDKARLLWAEAFSGPEAAPPAGAGALATSSIGGASSPGSVRPGSVSGTRHLTTGENFTPPPGARQSGATLGSASGYQLERRPAARSKIAVLVGAAVAVGALVLIGARLMHPDHPVATASPEPAAPAPPPSPPATRPARPKFRVDVDVVPATATVELDGVATGVGALLRELAADGREHRLV